MAGISGRIWASVSLRRKHRAEAEMRKLKLEELGRKTIREFKEAKKIPVTVILDNVRSRYNVGSVFRSADAFLVEKIFLCGITPVPPHKEIRKTALGADESVEWAYEKDVLSLLERLKEQGYRILCIEQAEGSRLLSEFQFQPETRYAVIFGNEVDGVTQQAVDSSDACIEVPQAGTKHSLNVSVCAGVVLWEMFKNIEKPDNDK